jgi:serine protease AprX
VNLSLGVEERATGKRHRVLEYVEELTRRGVIVVAAAGNTPGKRPVPPGSAPSAITVGGCVDFNRRGQKEIALWHGSYGRFPNGTAKPDLLAPALYLPAPILLNTAVKTEAEALFYMLGGDDESMFRAIPVLAPETNIAGLLNRAAVNNDPEAARRAIISRIKAESLINANYKMVDGTSFASAIVASIVAQMLEARPGISPALAKERLMSTAHQIPGVNPVRQGAGVVRAALISKGKV